MFGTALQNSGPVSCGLLQLATGVGGEARVGLGPVALLGVQAAFRHAGQDLPGSAVGARPEQGLAQLLCQHEVVGVCCLLGCQPLDRVGAVCLHRLGKQGHESEHSSAPGEPQRPGADEGCEEKAQQACGERPLVDLVPDLLSLDVLLGALQAHPDLLVVDGGHVLDSRRGPNVGAGSDAGDVGQKVLVELAEDRPPSVVLLKAARDQWNGGSVWGADPERVEVDALVCRSLCSGAGFLAVVFAVREDDERPVRLGLFAEELHGHLDAAREVGALGDPPCGLVAPHVRAQHVVVQGQGNVGVGTACEEDHPDPVSLQQVGEVEDLAAGPLQPRRLHIGGVHGPAHVQQHQHIDAVPLELHPLKAPAGLGQPQGHEEQPQGREASPHPVHPSGSSAGEGGHQGSQCGQGLCSRPQAPDEEAAGRQGHEPEQVPHLWHAEGHGSLRNTVSPRTSWTTRSPKPHQAQGWYRSSVRTNSLTSAVVVSSSSMVA